MPKHVTRLALWFTCVSLISSLSAADGGASTVPLKDAGFEAVREVVVAGDTYIYNAIIKEGMDLGNDGAPVVVLPAMLSQFCGCKKLHVVEGDAGTAVHSGRRAILLTGSIYLDAHSDATTGDIFTVRVYAKGRGTFRAILHLTNADNRYFGQAVPSPMPVASEAWTLLEQILTTADKPNLKQVWLRLETSGDVCLDDLELIRKPR